MSFRRQVDERILKRDAVELPTVLKVLEQHHGNLRIARRSPDEGIPEGAAMARGGLAIFAR